MALPILRRGGNAVPVHRGNGNPMVQIDPWNDFDYMDRVFESFFRAPFSALERKGFTGRSEGQMEIYESADELVAVAHAPGLKKDSFDINATATSLSVRGERKPLWENTEGLTAHTPWTTAVSSGTFSAEYALPVEIDPNAVRATYTDGVLEIHMPKSENVKPKQVKIDVKDA